MVSDIFKNFIFPEENELLASTAFGGRPLAVVENNVFQIESPAQRFQTPERSDPGGVASLRVWGGRA